MKTHKKLVSRLLLLVIGMFGFGYALVPIYNHMCKFLGINGKVANVASIRSKGGVDLSRTITVEFTSMNGSALPWHFHPTIKKVKIHPGEMKKVSFFAENTTDRTMTVQAIPSVTPGIAAKYFKKTECFCFTRQTFLAHESLDMPLLFHLDRDLPKNIRTITLSYTLYDVSHRG